MPEKDLITLPKHIQSLFSLFEYYANLIKLDYLEACCSNKFDQNVLNELRDLYQKQPVTVLGGMNEAFRWHLGCDDFENTTYYADTNIPIDCNYPKRVSEHRLFIDYDPYSRLPAQMLQQLSQALSEEVNKTTDFALAAAILAEFMAMKVSMHDLFIHGRGMDPAVHLQNTDYVASLIHAYKDMPVNAFRLKFALSMAMSKGFDPVQCVTNTCSYEESDRQAICSGLQSLLKHWREIDLSDYFRWDVFGICAFIEGPIYARKHPGMRLAFELSQAWQSTEWHGEKTSTDVSKTISESVVKIILDHSIDFPDRSADYFILGSKHTNDMEKLHHARQEYSSLNCGEELSSWQK